jgi:hypothetical protein
MLEYILCCLITHGLAFSMAVTHGPFGLFHSLRTWSARRFGTAHWIAIGFGCPICVSFWLSFAVSISLGGGIVMALAAFGFVNVITSLSPD